MSLIDEALKRAAGRSEEKRASGAPAPWTPPPLPDPSRARRQRAIRALAWVAGVGAVIAFAGYLFLPGAEPRAETAYPPAAPEAAATPAPPALEMTAVEVEPPPAARPMRDLAAPVLEAPPVSSAPESPVVGSGPSPGQLDRTAPLPAPTPPAFDPPAPIPVLAAASGSPSIRSSPRPIPTERPHLPTRTYAGVAPLPGGGRLELGGIVYSAENPVALINGRVVSPGRMIEGYTLVEIRPDRVRLEGEGQALIITLR